MWKSSKYASETPNICKTLTLTWNCDFVGFVVLNSKKYCVDVEMLWILEFCRTWIFVDIRYLNHKKIKH